MIQDNLNKMIMEAMKNHDTVRTETLREIKTTFMKWRTSAENVGKEFTDDIEQQVLLDLSNSYKKAIADFEKQNRTDLVESYKPQLEIIKEFLPSEPTEEDAMKMFLQVRENEGLEPIKKNMGTFVKRIKELLPGVDGKMVAQLVQRQLA